MGGEDLLHCLVPRLRTSSSSRSRLAHVEAEPLHPGAVKVAAEAGALERATQRALLPRIAESGQPDIRPLWAVALEEPAHRLRAADASTATPSDDRSQTRGAASVSRATLSLTPSTSTTARTCTISGVCRACEATAGEAEDLARPWLRCSCVPRRIWSPIEPPGSIGSLSCQMRQPIRPIPTRTTSSKTIETTEITSSQFLIPPPPCLKDRRAAPCERWSGRAPPEGLPVARQALGAFTRRLREPS